MKTEVPAVTFVGCADYIAMPEAGRDEYLEDSLRRAARIVHIWRAETSDEKAYKAWEATEVEALREMLFTGEPLNTATDVRSRVRWEALMNHNLPRIHASDGKTQAGGV